MIIALLLSAAGRAECVLARDRACVEDVACRIIAAHQRPNDATIERHERTLADLFGEVLAHCAAAGVATVGVIAIDGTKVAGNANRDRTMG
jgi:hypothetical protein